MQVSNVMMKVISQGVWKSCTFFLNNGVYIARFKNEDFYEDVPLELGHRPDEYHELWFEVMYLIGREDDGTIPEYAEYLKRRNKC